MIENRVKPYSRVFSVKMNINHFIGNLADGLRNHVCGVEQMNRAFKNTFNQNLIRPYSRVFNVKMNINHFIESLAEGLRNHVCDVEQIN